MAPVNDSEKPSVWALSPFTLTGTLQVRPPSLEVISEMSV